MKSPLFSFFFFFITVFYSHSSIMSPKGELEFYVQGQRSATLSPNGLLIGSGSPELNFETSGNSLFKNIQINGSLIQDFRLVQGNVTLSDNYMHMLDTSGANLEISLPSAASVRGQRYFMKKTQDAGSAFILPSTNEEVEGQKNLRLNDRQYLELFSDGSNWHVIGGQYETLSSDNLRFHWKLDDQSTTQTDSMGSGYDLSLLDNTSANTLVSGVSGNAIYIERDNQWVRNTAMNGTVSLGNTATFSVWVNFEVPPSIRGNNGVVMMTVGGTNAFRYIVQTDNDVSNTSVTIGQYTLRADVWYNFTLVEDGAYQNYYINGQFIGKTANSIADITLDDIYLSRACCSNLVTGRFDDFRIYDKDLSAAEVMHLYVNQGK